MAPVAVSTPVNAIHDLKVSLSSSTVPETLPDVLSWVVHQYPNHELAFMTSSAHDFPIQAKTFSELSKYTLSLAKAIRAWGKPTGSVVVVYLTEHEDNMTAIWACLLAGYVPCLQPALSAQQAHKEGHVAHITKVLSSQAWLTNEIGADQLQSISGLEIHLLSSLKASAEDLDTNFVVHQPRPDDEAVLFLTSGSTGFSKLSCTPTGLSLLAVVPRGKWVGLDHVAGLLEMHITPLLCGASQLHVHASAILSDSLRYIRLIEENSIEVTFAPNFLLAKLTRDLEKRSDLFGTFNLASLRQISSGGEAVVSDTAIAFSKTLQNLGGASFVISAGFGMTETCAGCIYDSIDVLTTSPSYEFLELGTPIAGCEMRIVNPEDGVTPRPDGQNGEFQVRGPMIFTRYYNNPDATSSSFVEGGWYRTGDIGIIENGRLRLVGRIKDTVIVHGVSYSIPELETHLQTVEGVTPSFLTATPYRVPGQETEGFVILYSPTFNLNDEDAPTKLFAAHRALRGVSVKMVGLPPQLIVPIPADQMEKTTLGKLYKARLINQFRRGELAKYISRAEELLSIARGANFVIPSTVTEKRLARIYADIFNLNVGEISAGENFFELGGNSIYVIRLKRAGESAFGLPEIPTIQILGHPVLSSLAKCIDSLIFKDSNTEVYDPIVPLNPTGNKTPIFMVHPGIGEVLVFVNLAKHFRNEHPLYALRARGFEPGHPFFSSMNEMVSSYTAAVKRTQPHGPYAIAGYSYGGVVAFEIAKRLEEMGDEVKFTGLINIPPHIGVFMREMDWTDSMPHLSFVLGLVSNQDANNLVTSLKPLTRKDQLDVIWKMSPPERLVELQLTPEKFDHWVNLGGSLIECGKAYEPRGSISSMDVFYAIPLRGTKEDWLNDHLKAWGRFSHGELTYIDVPGHHNNLMDADHASGFQKILRSRLEARGL